ncbi:tetratricopeptide repeat protein, partial [Candidatus Poribacteria bacterium]|nr:tetratricopeptide repeat protein [Candidatus Poribacteria bacterium]
IKLNPSDTSLLEGLATLYQQQGKYQKALELYKNVLEKNPTNATIREKLGSLYIEIGDKEKAIAEWEKMVTDGFDRYQQLGSIYLSHKMYDEAIEAFLKSIQANPKYGYLYTQLAFAYKIKGNIDKAARTYLEGLRQIGSSVNQRASIWEAMLEIYQGEQQKPLREKLIAEYSHALKTSPNNLNTAIILGELYFYAGQFDDTLKTYKLIHPFFPTTIETALQRLARILERDQDPQAIAFFTTLLALSRNTSILTNTRYSLAKIYQNLEQWDQAAATLKELDKNSAASIESQLMRAKIQLYGLHNPKEAQITLQPLQNKRLDYNQHMQVQLTLGEIHLLLGRYTLARQVLTPIADSISPFSSSARKLIGDSYLFATEFDQALKEYRKAVLRTQSDKLTNDALERIVLIQANTDYLGIPLSDYVNALQHYLSGDTKPAIVQCEDTISLHNKSLIIDDMWMLLGRIHRSQKSYGDAIHSYRQVVTLESSLAPHALANIAEIYKRKQDWTNALETYTTLLSTFPNNTIVPHARQQMDNVTKNIKNTGSNTP